MSPSQTLQPQKAVRESPALPLEDRVVRAFGIARGIEK